MKLKKTSPTRPTFRDWLAYRLLGVTTDRAARLHLQILYEELTIIREFQTTRRHEAAAHRVDQLIEGLRKHTTPDDG